MTIGLSGVALKPVKFIEACIRHDEMLGCEYLGSTTYNPPKTNFLYSKPWTSQKRWVRKAVEYSVVFEDDTNAFVGFFLPAYPDPSAALVMALFESLFGNEPEKEAQAGSLATMTITSGSAASLLVLAIGLQGGARWKRRRKE